LSSNLNTDHSDYHPLFKVTTDFYSLPALHPKQIKFAKKTLSQQILQTDATIPHILPVNPFHILLDKGDQEDTMDIDDTSTNNIEPTYKKMIVTWSADSGISALTGDIFTHMESQKQKAVDTCDKVIDSPDYRKPQDHVDSKEKLSKRIQFNLIRHRGAHSDTKVLELFKSFTTTLKKADPSLIIHPFQASQQHFSSLATQKTNTNNGKPKAPPILQIISSKTDIFFKWLLPHFICPIF